MSATPSVNATLPLRHGDFATLTEALDYAAQGETGITFYSARGEILSGLSWRTVRERAQATARRRYHADMAQAAGDDDAAARSGDLDHCGGAAASGGMVDGSGGAAGGPPRVFRLDRASDYVTPDDTVRHLAFMCALIKATNRFIAVAAAAAETA